MTASTCIVKLDVETAQAELYSWLMVAPDGGGTETEMGISTKR